MGQAQICMVKYSRYMTCQSNSTKGRGHPSFAEVSCVRWGNVH